MFYQEGRKQGRKGRWSLPLSSYRCELRDRNHLVPTSRVSLAFAHDSSNLAGFSLSSLRGWRWLLWFHLFAINFYLYFMFQACFQHTVWIDCTVKQRRNTNFALQLNLTGDGVLSTWQTSVGGLQCTWLMKHISWHTSKTDITYLVTAHLFPSDLIWETPAAKASEKDCLPTTS